jgi:hypothetical protein
MYIQLAEEKGRRVWKEEQGSNPYVYHWIQRYAYLYIILVNKVLYLSFERWHTHVEEIIFACKRSLFLCILWLAIFLIKLIDWQAFWRSKCPFLQNFFGTILQLVVELSESTIFYGFWNLNSTTSDSTSYSG